jgi:hypothetical protein
VRIARAAQSPGASLCAIVLEKFGGLDSLAYKNGEWAEVAPVRGIECVGLVKSCPGGEFPVGSKVWLSYMLEVFALQATARRRQPLWR